MFLIWRMKIAILKYEVKILVLSLNMLNIRN